MSAKKVTAEMTRLQGEKKLELALPLSDTSSTSENTFNVVFHNVRSLHKHISDIKSCQFYTAADLLMFVEANISPSDEIEAYRIPGFYSYMYPFTLTVDNRRSVYGTAVYSRSPLLSKYIQNVQLQPGIEFTIIVLHNILDMTMLVVVALYASPSTTMERLQTVLQDITSRINHWKPTKIILLGDLNVDLLKRKNNPILDILDSCDQKISLPTTDYGSLIDHVYSDIPNSRSEWGVFESYFSDHKPLWGCITELDE